MSYVGQKAQGLDRTDMVLHDLGSARRCVRFVLPVGLSPLLRRLAEGSIVVDKASQV